MKPEYIILGLIVLVAAYIIIEASINSKKISKNKTAKKPDKAKVKALSGKDEVVEVKSVVTPTLNDLDRGMNSFEMSMEQAAMESIEDERSEKTAYAKAQADIIRAEEDAKRQKEQSELEKQVDYYKNKLDQLDLNAEEQGFVNEIKNLSPELKAVMFADLLKRKGQ